MKTYLTYVCNLHCLSVESLNPCAELNFNMIDLFGERSHKNEVEHIDSLQIFICTYE